jgi:hypothetical protein
LSLAPRSPWSALAIAAAFGSDRDYISFGRNLHLRLGMEGSWSADLLLELKSGSQSPEYIKKMQVCSTMLLKTKDRIFEPHDLHENKGS